MGALGCPFYLVGLSFAFLCAIKISRHSLLLTIVVVGVHYIVGKHCAALYPAICNVCPNKTFNSTAAAS
jgi:hypothetical protein